MKAIAAILLLAMTGGVLADTAKPAATSDKANKSYIYDSARTPLDGRHPYLDDRLLPRRLLLGGFRSDASEASPNSAQDKPTPESAPAPKKRPG